jgi:hypothetical protein
MITSENNEITEILLLRSIAAGMFQDQKRGEDTEDTELLILRIHFQSTEING